MTAPIPEERDGQPLPTEGTPPGEHDSDLPDGADSPTPDSPVEEEQERNAETTEDQPSQ